MITSNVAGQSYTMVPADNVTDVHEAVFTSPFQWAHLYRDFINTQFPGATQLTFTPSMVVTCNSTAKTVTGASITFDLLDFSDCPQVQAELLTDGFTTEVNSGMFTAEIPFTGGSSGVTVSGTIQIRYDDSYGNPTFTNYDVSACGGTIVVTTDNKIQIQIPTDASCITSHGLSSGDSFYIFITIHSGFCDTITLQGVCEMP